MKANAKVILGIKTATDEQVSNAEKAIAENAKAFVAKHPRANNWNQAVNAKFLLFCLAEAKDDVSKAVIAHEMSNASAMRQWLVKDGIIKPVDAFEEF